MKASDRKFLAWIRDRLEHIHGESPNQDFMHRLERMSRDSDEEIQPYDPYTSTAQLDWRDNRDLTKK